MPIDWKARLRTAGEDLEPPAETIQVLIDLETRTADEARLRKLEDYGVTVEEVVDNKIIGRLPGDRLDDLRADPEVAEVEISTRLEPTATGSRTRTQHEPPIDEASSRSEVEEDSEPSSGR